MNLKVFRNKFDNAKKWVFNLTIIVFFLCITIIYLVHTVVTRTATEKTVFVPGIKKEFWVTNNDMSKDVKEQAATFIAYSLLNVTKDNIDNGISLVLPFVFSHDYDDVKITLKELNNYIVLNNISRSFFFSYADIKSNKIFVHGYMKDIIGGKVVNDGNVVLTIDYKVDFGMFKIRKIFIGDKENVEN